MARGDHHGQQCSQELLSSVELAVDGTGKRVTRWLGGGQRGPVRRWVGVVWWAGAVVVVLVP